MLTYDFEEYVDLKEFADAFEEGLKPYLKIVKGYIAYDRPTGNVNWKDVFMDIPNQKLEDFTAPVVMGVCPSSSTPQKCEQGVMMGLAALGEFKKKKEIAYPVDLEATLNRFKYSSY